MQGQANHFYRFSKERIPYPTQRYVGETERLFGILDIQLKDRDYLVGPGKGKYSIADIANFSWANVGYFAGIDVSSFANVSRWLERINAREAVKKGVAVPTENKLVNPAYQRKLAEEPEFAAKEKELKELADKSKKQYDYKFKSP